jgi:hypothetical protein
LKTDDSRGNKEIAMVTKLISNDNNNNSFKLPYAIYFLKIENIYMTILTREERERLVLDLTIIRARLIVKYLRKQEYRHVI